MPVFEPLPDECCNAYAHDLADHVAHLGRRVTTFTCPACGQGRVLYLLREETPVLLVRAGGEYHRPTCPWSLHGTPYRDGEPLDHVFATTLLHDGQPQPCPLCLGPAVAAYLGVRP